jgi:1-acyl-sn-glycerol-3-phosphate acyltransferase
LIPARKTRFMNWWFPRHVEGRIRGAFEAVHIRGLERFAALSRESPLLLVSNHSSWWDPMTLIYLMPRRLRLDAYAMMDEKNLRRFPFLGRVGAFGVDLRGGRAEPSLRYAEGLLDRAGRVVLVYPQGRERASTVRPLGFRRGSALVASRVSGAPVVPLGVRYEVAGTEHPLMFLSFGEPLPPIADVEEGRARQEEAVTAELDTLDDRVCRLRDGDEAALQGFEAVLERRPGLVDRLATFLLATFTRRAARSRADRSAKGAGSDPPSSPDAR